MLSLPHLVVLFVVALIIFGPQKLPELARMLGKATAEFRKMTSDFRFALEDEVRELERQTRIREEEAATAARAAQPPVPAPEGAVARDTPPASAPALPEGHIEPALLLHAEPSGDTVHPPHVDPVPVQPDPQDAVSVPHEKSPDDNAAV